MKSITTKNGKLICVEVPMETHTFTKEGYSSPFLLCYKYKQMEEDFDIEIPQAFEIIGTITDGKLDFDAEPYVGKNDIGTVWKDYTNPVIGHHGVEMSFLSLITSQKIEYAGKKLVILQTK